ncbi:MAG: UV damage repair endonuclease UvsE [Deltaproteobacteria bacterium RIFOXYB12_FULL_58_9]|nr:MAG: UV damage repair endonuclease UvsE [Deltaproteobacteria bacterium RIFOXYB12_FULL_58_9]
MNCRGEDVRLGLCCIFQDEPISFRKTTAKSAKGRDLGAQMRMYQEIADHNADSLGEAIQYCAHHSIGSFRVNSQILPLCTHPELGYEPTTIGGDTIERFRAVGRLAKAHDIRLTFHPDQFVVLSTPHTKVLSSSLKEIEYHAEVASWIGADVINIHAGGGYGDKPAALARFVRAWGRLSERARALVTIENDDRVFTPADLLPMCRDLQIPLVYDVHHHRCLNDGTSVEQVTDWAMDTWNREPLFHVSSPKEGWHGKQPSRHHDFIHMRDYPRFWEGLHCTVEVEAKAKEVAIKKLQEALRARRRRPQQKGT